MVWIIKLWTSLFNWKLIKTKKSISHSVSINIVEELFPRYYPEHLAKIEQILTARMFWQSIFVFKTGIFSKLVEL